MKKMSYKMMKEMINEYNNIASKAMLVDGDVEKGMKYGKLANELMTKLNG